MMCSCAYLQSWLFLLTVALSWVVAQVLKHFFSRTKFHARDVFSNSGGMPSAHTAATTSFVAMEFLLNGFTPLFVLSLLILGIIVTDARGVRYATGKNAKVLKHIIKDLKLKDHVSVINGHTTKQVVYGAVVGFVIASGLLIFVKLLGLL